MSILRWACLDRSLIALLVVVCGALFLPTPCFAQSGGLLSDDSEWTESEVKLPAFPVDKDLLAIRNGNQGSFRFFIDASSLEVGKDGVVRFVLVARSPGGAVNVSFEGIRCATREKKLYAVGRMNRAWAALENPRWFDYRGRAGGGYHEWLAQQYFCIEKTPVPTVQRIIEGIRRG